MQNIPQQQNLKKETRPTQSTDSLKEVVPDQILPQPEMAKTPEQFKPAEEGKETTVQPEVFLDDSIEGLKKTLKKPKKQKPLPQVRDNITIKVEEILSDGLVDAYRAMSPIQQQEFKIKGEQTAVKIRDLLRDTHVKVKKIFLLILEWLKFLPGVNRFFLEQEAKIKADKIISLKHFDEDNR